MQSVNARKRGFFLEASLGNRACLFVYMMLVTIRAILLRLKRLWSDYVIARYN
jgi:hypothetical protein